MKKSLSLLLSIALIFGAFASAASAAESDLTTQQKYDALAAKGIFAGINGEAALDQKMTRAQFARVLALILGLEGIGNPDTKVVSEKPFSDVKVDAWYAEEVAAVKEAGAMVGNADGTFNPQGNVTVQELAVAIAQALKLEPVKDAKVEGAADWAAGYIQALKDAGISVPTNYTEAATRGQLVDATYAADLKLNPVEPAKVSVVSAKATGVSEIEVVLDKAVDTEKAKFEVKFGTAAVTLDKTTWSDDKKTATLVLKDQKIKEGTYTVTLTGLEDAAIANKSATFQGEKETVTKIEFVTASDEIAKSKKAKIKVRAENQYGDLATFAIASYTVNTGDLTPTKKIDDEGYLIITVDTSGKNTGLDVVPVYVYFNDTRVVASKTFRVGATPFVSKMELGEVSYNNESKALVKSGNVATIPVNLYDQYGNPVTPEQETADGLSINWSSYITPFQDALVTEYDSSDDAYKVKVSVAPNKKIEKTGEYQINVFAGAATSIAKFQVKSERVAKDVAIGDPSKTIAAGDSEAIIPIYVTDEAGNELTAQEIVDNKGRIQVTGGSLIEYGKDKGKVRVTAIPSTKNSYFSLSVMVNSSIGEAPGYDNKTFQVAETRVPTSLVVETAPAAKAVLAGASSDFKVVVKDQYGEKLDKGAALADAYTVVATVTGAVYATADGKDDNAVNDLNTTNTTLTYTYNAAAPNGFDVLHDGFAFNSTGVVGKTEVKFVLKKGADEIDSETVRIETIPATSELTYSLEPVGELYAAIDKKDVYFGGDANPVTNKVAKKVKVVVKDASGNTVAIPNRVREVVTSDLSLARGAVNANEGYVLGNKAGTGFVTVYVNAADGTVKALTSALTVKSDPIVVKELTTKAELDINTDATIADIYTATEVKAKDQYGVTIEKGDVLLYDDLLGIRFTISEIRANGPANTVTFVDADTINVGANVQEFVLTAVSRDGQVSSSTLVKRD